MEAEGKRKGAGPTVKQGEDTYSHSTTACDPAIAMQLLNAHIKRMYNIVFTTKGRRTLNEREERLNRSLYKALCEDNALQWRLDMRRERALDTVCRSAD